MTLLISNINLTVLKVKQPLDFSRGFFFACPNIYDFVIIFEEV